MRALDRVLQGWRIRKAIRHVPSGSSVLDIGCSRGELLLALRSRITRGVGIDPDASPEVLSNRITLVSGRFPAGLDVAEPFDVITMLAVFEHVPPESRAGFAASCAELLSPGGLMIMTVPSPAADLVLDVLKAVRLIDGMDLEHHQHLQPSEIPPIFEAAGLELVHRSSFQIRFNNLFVFRKPSAGSGTGRQAS